jgi:formyl-CoA transferase
VRLGDTANPTAARHGKPLDGVRVLALEQMQALPFATQLLARLGAEVVKIEHPEHGESGRSSAPAMLDPFGRAVGATFLRNNFNKRSVGIDLKSSEGRALVLELVSHFDVLAENFKAGTLDRLGLGYDDVAPRCPHLIYLSISGFGNRGDSPYRDWPAYASIVEAMSGLYQYKAGSDEPPVTVPAGALGDISSALFGVIGVLAALRHRDATGEGQYVDIAMLDAMIAMSDVVTGFYSFGLGANDVPVICEGFKASDGYVVAQIGREHQFAALADLVSHSEWTDDARFATREGWIRHIDSDIRPAVDEWASNYTKLEAAERLKGAGIAAGPSNTAADVVADPHVDARNMLVEMERTDGVDAPVLVPGNPVKMSNVTEGPETRIPWIGEHTDEVLRAELGLDDNELRRLHRAGTISQAL